MLPTVRPTLPWCRKTASILRWTQPARTASASPAKTSTTSRRRSCCLRRRSAPTRPPELIFNTGITDAHDDGTVSDYVVIEFNALVANVASNQAAPPTSLTTNFHVSIGGITCDCLGKDTLTVEEPSITNLTKTAVVNAAGTAATYTVTFSNTGDSTAYDVQVVDNLPAGLTLDPASVQVVGGTGLVNNSTAAGLNLNFDSIAPNGTVTITYTAAIAAADQNGQPVTNIVNLDYTSLPGPNGTNPNPTGSVTPGTPAFDRRAKWARRGRWAEPLRRHRVGHDHRPASGGPPG